MGTRNSNFITVKRDMRYAGIKTILRSNIGKKRN